MRVHLFVCLITALVPSWSCSPAHAQSLADLQGIFALPFDGSSYQPTLDETKHIESLIDSLKEISSIEFLDALDTTSRARFAPTEESGNIGLGLYGFNDHREVPPAVLVLTKYGPKAMPALLRHIDDATATKFTFDYARMDGSLSFSSLFHTEESNPFDALVASMEPKLASNSEKSRDERVKQYNLTVGDVCFAVLGHIVYRTYSPISCFPASSGAIESPAHDPDMALAIRKIWQCDDPAKRLYQSLYCDYAADNGCGEPNAALRLLYYFPRETSPFFVNSLFRFSENDLDDCCEGYERDQLISYLSHVDAPKFTDEIVELINNSRDGDIVLGCINSAIVAKHRALVFNRIQHELFDAPMKEADHWTHAAQSPAVFVKYNAGWLRAAAKFYPEEAQSIFEEYLQQETTDQASDIIIALSGLRLAATWPVEILRPYLSEKEVADFEPNLNELDDLEDDSDARVCDWAAKTIINYIPGATFYLESDDDYRDRQIANILARLDGNPTTPLTEEQFVDLDTLPYLAPDKTVAIDRSPVLPYKCSTGETLFTCAGNIDVASGQFIVREMQTSPFKRGICFSGEFNGRQLYFDSEDSGSFKEYDLLTGALLRRVPTPFTWKDDKGPNAINDVAVVGGNEAVMIGTNDGVVHLLHLDSRALETIYKTRGFLEVSLVALPATPRTLVADGSDVLLWDNKKKSFRTLGDVPHSGWGTPMGDYAISRHDELEVWDLINQKKIRLQLPRALRKPDIDGDPAKPWALVNFKDGRCYLFDLEQQKAICVLKLSRDLARDYTMTSDGKWLVSTSDFSVHDATGRWKPRTEFSLFSIERIEQFKK